MNIDALKDQMQQVTDDMKYHADISDDTYASTLPVMGAVGKIDNVVVAIHRNSLSPEENKDVELLHRLFLEDGEREDLFQASGLTHERFFRASSHIRIRDL